MKRLVAEIIYKSDKDPIINETTTISDNMLDATFGAMDRGNNLELLNYGIYANKGSFSFIDRERNFQNLYNKYQKQLDGKVVFYLGFVDDSNRIATFDIDNAIIDEETQKVDVELASPLLKWQNIEIDRYTFNDGSLFKPRSIQYIIVQIRSILGININVISNRPSETRIWCFDVPEKTTFWNFMTSICKVSLCRIFDDKDGNACIVDEEKSQENIVEDILVNPNNIIEFEKPSNSSVSSFEIVERKIQYVEKTPQSKEITIFDNILDAEEDRFSENVGNEATISLSAKYKTNIDGIEEYVDGFPTALSEPVTVRVEYEGKFDNIVYNFSGLELYATYVSTGSGYHGKEKIEDSNINNINFSILDSGERFAVSFDIQKARYGENYSLYFIQSLEMKIYTSYYNDIGEEKHSYKRGEKETYILSDFLLQTENTYSLLPLYENILNTIKNKYPNPIKCFTLDCFLGEYADVDGNVLLNKYGMFRKYDTIIPYILVKGKRTPYSTYDDGSPSRYRIVGVEYSYVGFFRQRLHLQEIYKHSD